MDVRAKLVTVVPMVALVPLVVLFAHPPMTALRLVGIVGAVVGFAMLTASRITLGDSFSVAPRARRLVTHGVYRRIRNPVYVFSALGLAGLALYVERPDLLWLLVVIVPMQVFRARAEARVLEERFGDEYRRYRAGTWF